MLEVIVVGTDGSHTAAEAVRHAAELARSVHARVHIVSAHGGGAPDGAARAAVGAFPEAGALLLEGDVEAVLLRAAQVVGARGVEVETHAVKGDPADAILDVAEAHGADLIVVGNRGMHGGRRFLLGNVPNKVSHHARCSVLIARTD